MKRLGIVSSAFLFIVLSGVTALSCVPLEQQGEKQHKPDKQTKTDKQKDKQEQHQITQQEKHAQQQQDQASQQQERAQQQNIKSQQQQNRLSEQRPQQLIREQQQRQMLYRKHLENDWSLAQLQRTRLQEQGRMAQYRLQEQYLERLRQQNLLVQNDLNHDYSRDAYYYTAPSSRYERGGRYYQTNAYGVNVLRQAVNYGYEEGFRTGSADQQDRWRFSSQDSRAYQDANYGYNGYYISQDDYNHYFREGFRRGYEDGYNSRSRYGQLSDGRYNILGPVLTQILGLQSLR